jgi:hypothetical protein
LAFFENRGIAGVLMRYVLPLIGLLFTSSLWAEDVDAVKLLDKAIRHPGIYSQICDLQLIPAPAPLPAFRQVLNGEAVFSPATLEVLSKNRVPVLAAVSQKLKSLDLFAKPKEQPLDPSIKKDEDGNYESDSAPRGYDPGTYNTLLLRVIQELDGAEALPALLEFEQRYNAVITKVEKDPTAQPPTVDGAEGAGVALDGLFNDEKGDAIDYEKLTEPQRKVYELRGKVFSLIMAQRDMLAVMVHIMRKAGFEPFLNCPLEAEYGKLLKEKAAEHETLRAFKAADDIPEADRDAIKYDPVHKVAYFAWDPVMMKFSEEKRSLIRQLTEEFIKKQAPAKP